VTPIEYAMIALAVGILFSIYLTYSKDGEQNRKIRAIASVLEKSQRELYMLDKKIEQELTILSETMPSESSLHVKESVKVEVDAISEALGIALRDIENSFDVYQTKSEGRLSKLESSIKSLILPSSVSGMDDEKIISLYNQGIGLDTIAKELRISKPEVEFVLKINQLQ